MKRAERQTKGGRKEEEEGERDVLRDGWREQSNAYPMMTL